MNYRNMGKTGLKVSEVCLGTMTFGHGTDESGAKAMVDLGFDAGINFFDTADGYQTGASEIMLGKVLKGRRRDAVIASKFFNPMGPGPNDSGTGSGCTATRSGQGALVPFPPRCRPSWGREKGTGTFCAKHPPGLSGKMYLSPFSRNPA